MADYTLLGNLGSQALSAYGDYSVSKTQSKMEESAKKHKETMDALSAAQQLSSLSKTEREVTDAGVRASVSLQVTAIQDQSAAEVAAAASGVAGNSVESTMQNLRRSALNANEARKASITSRLSAIQTDKNNVKMSQIYGRDTSVTLAPDPASALLGLGMSLLKTYDENQPKGTQVSDTLNSLFNR